MRDKRDFPRVAAALGIAALVKRTQEQPCDIRLKVYAVVKPPALHLNHQMLSRSQQAGLGHKRPNLLLLPSNHM